MTVAFRNVRDVALAERFDPVTAMRTEHGDLKIPRDDVLPFIGVRVPVQFAQAARFLDRRLRRSWSGKSGSDWRRRATRARTYESNAAPQPSAGICAWRGAAVVRLAWGA